MQLPDFLLPNLPPEALAQLREIELRESAQRHIVPFARYVVEVEPAQHHRLFCQALEDLTVNDRYDDLIINTPPGSAKSSYISHVFPSWFLGRFPAKNLILASNTAALAEKWSRRIRNTFQSASFANVFPDATLSPDSTAVARWTTSSNGECVAAGVGASILGFRADCVPGSTLIRTQRGVIRIDAVKDGDYALSYDETLRAPAYRRIVATARRKAHETVRIHTVSGRVVEATPEHRIFVGGCWLPAGSVIIGSVLLRSVFDTDGLAGQRDGKEGPQGTDRVVLQQVVRYDNHQSEEWSATPPDMQQLWEGVLSPVAGERGACVLGRVLDSNRQGERRQAQNGERAGLSDVQVDLSPPNISAEANFLLPRLCGESTRDGDVKREQSELATRERPIPLSGWERADVQTGEESVDATGQLRVRGLQHAGELVNASRGHGLNQQYPEQCCDAVRPLPLDVSRSGTGEVVEDTVALVERVCEEQFVYDIQVEGTACFFANDILIHNCVVIDDPLSGWEQASSETQLQKLHDWYRSDLKSRLKPNAKIVLVCQRLAANDLAGMMIQEYAENPTRRLKVINLPMVAEADDPADDPLGRSRGDILWPEWYTPEMVADLRKDDLMWRTMWQQQPPSSSGDWIGAEDILIRPSPPADQPRTTYGMTDLALSVNGGDYTVHFVVGIDQYGDWDILDAVRERVDPDTTSSRIVALSTTYSPQEWLIDDDNMAKVLMPLVATLARSLNAFVPWKMLPMRGQDKETRAAPLRGMFKRRKIYMPADASFRGWLTKELLTFPNAIGQGVDDGIDSLGLLGRRLMAIAKPAAPVAPPAPPPTTLNMTLDGLFEERARLHGTSPLSRRRI